MKNIKAVLFLGLIATVLLFPAPTFQYAYQGLYSWAVRMIPTLFPFMMISSLMIYTGTDREMGKLLKPVLHLLFPLPSYGLYVIFIGFLSGFPMGAKVVCDLYHEKKLSKEEADLLIGFCNNIGPSYFLGMICPILHSCGYHTILPFLFGMYGIPICYGILLVRFHAFQESSVPMETPTSYSLIQSLRMACLDNTQSLLLLGGYITFANALRVFLDLLPLSAQAGDVASCFLEIIGGIQTVYGSDMAQTYKVFWIMTGLSFGGISCLLQASCFLEKEKLSLLRYLLHKLILTGIAACYYWFLLFYLL